MSFTYKKESMGQESIRNRKTFYKRNFGIKPSVKGRIKKLEKDVETIQDCLLKFYFRHEPDTPFDNEEFVKCITKNDRFNK